MAKKQVAVSLRKPPSAETVRDVDVSEGTRSSYIADLRRFGGDELRRFGGDELKNVVSGLRSITVQLPADLASRLLLRCMQDDRDVSNVVAELVAGHLDRKVVEPEITIAAIVRWVRAKLAAMRFVGAFIHT